MRKLPVPCASCTSTLTLISVAGFGVAERLNTATSPSSIGPAFTTEIETSGSNAVSNTVIFWVEILPNSYPFLRLSSNLISPLISRSERLCVGISKVILDELAEVIVFQFHIIIKVNFPSHLTLANQYLRYQKLQVLGFAVKVTEMGFPSITLTGALSDTECGAVSSSTISTDLELAFGSAV